MQLSDAFKVGMRRFATGVTVVTTMAGGRPHGFTANAFCSVSVDPPLLLVCVNQSALSHALVAQAGVFCVNILALPQQTVAERFASRGDADRRFEDLAWHRSADGAPVLDSALAHFDCVLSEHHAAGSHTVFIGRVVDCSVNGGTPLGYFDGSYRDFGCKSEQLAG